MPRRDASPAGRALGRLARRAHLAALDARPDAERLARRAAVMARPATVRAGRFAREHEPELRRAGELAGQAVVWRFLPGPLRPLAGLFAGGLPRLWRRWRA